MPHRKQTQGKCAYCGAEKIKNQMTKHLSVCSQRQQAIATVERQTGERQALYHLRVEDASSGAYWLDLEMNGSAALKDLDKYLRAIWLECCNHLSQFSMGGWQGTEIAKRRTLDEIFEPGLELMHIYDFGTSSETVIRAIDRRQGKPTTRYPIALMARNLAPEQVCIECGQPATRFSMGELIQRNVWRTLCEEHAEEQPPDDYGEPVPLVNSPRLGMCGYSGPADPPY